MAEAVFTRAYLTAGQRLLGRRKALHLLRRCLHLPDTIASGHSPCAQGRVGLAQLIRQAVVGSAPSMGVTACALAPACAEA